jgi:glyoxylase-like metal-dependent hydrolase (beta-lactamase superfamily II)
MSSDLPGDQPAFDPDAPAADTPRYEVYAVKYAQRPARRPDHFVGGDPHDEPMDMDYYVWAVVGPDRTWVVDTGFEAPEAAARGRTLVRSVTEALATVDIDAAAVEDVIVTHLHYDHIGGFAQFPRATFHLQDDEMAYATGRHMAHRALNHGFTPDHIAAVVHLVYGGRVSFVDGDAWLAPGLSVHEVGGHTMGLQVVRVWTARGWLVLASDASHYYEHMERGRIFISVHDLGAMLEGHRRCYRLAASPTCVIPGHDPLVLERYPPARPGLDGIAVRLDVEPVG